MPQRVIRVQRRGVAAPGHAAALAALPLGWQFRASGGALELEASVYFGRGREQRRNQQLVVTGMVEAGEPVRVKWAFTKVGG